MSALLSRQPALYVLTGLALTITIMTPPLLAIWAPADPEPVAILRSAETGCVDVCTLSEVDAGRL